MSTKLELYKSVDESDLNRFFLGVLSTTDKRPLGMLFYGESAEDVRAKVETFLEAERKRGATKGEADDAAV